MQYEAYEKKIKKVAAFLALIFRHIVLALSLLVLLVGSTIAAICLKGTFIGISCPETIPYGEKIEPKANAILSSVRYEYSTDGEEWSDESPEEPGEYKLRAYAKRSFGVAYSEELSFEIVPREVEANIAEDCAVYGDKLTVLLDLADGDSVVACDFDAEEYREAYTAITDKGIVAKLCSRMSARVESIRIENADGIDVTERYSITAVPKQVAIIPRSITVTVQNTSKEYDGVPLAWDGYEISSGDLVGGDTIIATIDTVIEGVGEAVIVPQIHISSINGASIDKCYDVKIEEGRLSVRERSLIISTQSAEWEYDGKPHAATEYSIESGTLLEGHSLSLLPPQMIVDATDEALDNRLFFLVKDSDENDVSNLYSIIIDPGKLMVNHRILKTEMEDIEFTYDGKPHLFGMTYVFDAETGTLSDPTWDEYTSCLSVCDAGVYSMLGVPVRVILPFSNDENNGAKEKVDITGLINDITRNFKIEVESYGNITVNKRKLTVSTPDASSVYDGTRKYWSDNNFAMSGELCDSHTFSFVSSLDAIDAGTYENVARILISDAHFNDVGHNYDIEYVFGLYTIEKRPLTLVTNSASKIYDGEPLFAEGFTTENLVIYHEVKATLENTSITDVLDSGTFVYVDVDSVSIYDIWGQDVRQNYSIKVLPGMLRILPRPITIKTASRSSYYDATVHKHNELMAESYMQILPGHELSVEFLEESSVSEIPNGKKYAYVSNALDKEKTTITRKSDGADMLSNYSVKYIFGILTLLPREITVTTSSGSWVYDGNSHGAPFLDAAPDALVPGHSFNLIEQYDYAKKITFFGTMENKFSKVPIIDGDGKDVSSNYKVEQICGTIEITKRDVSLKIPNMIWTYNGTKRSVDEAKIAEGSPNDLPEGDVAKLVNPPSLIYVSSQPISNKPEDIMFVDARGKDISDCYNIIDVEYGTIEMSPRTVSTTSPSYTRYYDGTPLKQNIGELGGEDFEGYIVEYLEFPEDVIEPGIYPNFCSPRNVRIWGPVPEDDPTNAEGRERWSKDERLVDLTDNFFMKKVKSGLLTILEGTIVHVTIMPTTRIYGGRIEKIDFASCTSGYSNFDIDFKDISLSVDGLGSISYEALLAEEYKAVVKPKDPTDTNTYGVRFVLGDKGTDVLTVLPRPITVYAESANFQFIPLRAFDASAVTVGLGSLVNGHNIKARAKKAIVCGENFVPQVMKNEIDTILITDQEGNDVTSCYQITKKPGIVRIVQYEIDGDDYSQPLPDDTPADIEESLNIFASLGVASQESVEWEANNFKVTAVNKNPFGKIDTTSKDSFELREETVFIIESKTGSSIEWVTLEFKSEQHAKKCADSLSHYNYFVLDNKILCTIKGAQSTEHFEFIANTNVTLTKVIVKLVVG